MYVNGEDIFYYITVMNESWDQPEMPKGAKEGILKGMYKFKSSGLKDSKLKANLFGSGAMMPHAIEAAQILEDKYKVSADVWSITSYKELYRDGIACERWNMLHPAEKERVPYVTQQLKGAEGVFVASSDYVKALPESIAQWMPKPFIALGTDGYGRSESRAALRDHFEVDAKHIVVAALSGLFREGKLKAADVQKAIKDLGVDPEKKDPFTA